MYRNTGHTEMRLVPGGSAGFPKDHAFARVDFDCCDRLTVRIYKGPGKTDFSRGKTRLAEQHHAAGERSLKHTRVITARSGRGAEIDIEPVPPVGRIRGGIADSVIAG